MSKSKKPKTLKILCPFCNAPYSASMTEDLDSGEICDTCGWGNPRGRIIVTCDNCKKEVYVKEI